MKTRYGVAKAYRQDGSEYFYIAELYLDQDDVVGCTPIDVITADTDKELVRIIAQITMDIMGNSEPVDVRQLTRRGVM